MPRASSQPDPALSGLTEGEAASRRAEGRGNDFRPPASRIRNEAGMRMVAPEMPAMAVSVNSSAWLKGKPRLSICTVMMPHIPHTAKPHSSAGTEMARLR